MNNSVTFHQRSTKKSNTLNSFLKEDFKGKEKIVYELLDKVI